eukprot:scaffold84667_cov25-Prasinocladus_malaysianus.AAC.2
MESIRAKEIERNQAERDPYKRLVTSKRPPAFNPTCPDISSPPKYIIMIQNDTSLTVVETYIVEANCATTHHGFTEVLYFTRSQRIGGPQ